jgi:AraC-like DNA-binding protein
MPYGALAPLSGLRSDIQNSPKTGYREAEFFALLRVPSTMSSGDPIGEDDPESAVQRGAEFSRPLPADMVNAFRWLRGHLSEPVRLEQLADIAGVRPRTLETHFRLFLGTTPLGWVRRMRLTQARQRLLRSAGKATVTDVAVATEFNQLGRFAAEYRKVFGELPSATIQRSKGPPAEKFDEDVDEAIRLTLSALPLAFAVAREQCDLALEGLSRPLDLAPDYGLPKAVAGWCWAQRAAHDFGSTPDADRDRAYRLAEAAYDLGADDALTLTLSSGALVLLNRLDEADQRLERALALDPWLAYAWIRRGWMSAYLGDHDSAVHELRTALHLMPFDPLRHLTFIGMGCAHFAAERYDRAALWIRSGLETYPQSYWAERVAVAAVALTGAGAAARRMGRQLMREEPNLTVARARRAWPFTSRFMSCLGDGLEIAGVPKA